MAKLKLIHRCTECGASFPKWSGKCLSCGAWNSLVEDVEGPEESAVTLAAGMPFKAYRWVPEMNEIAKTFEGTGLTPKIFQGASDLYAQIAGTPQGKESPEDARAKGRKGTEVINDLADTIK